MRYSIFMLLLTWNLVGCGTIGQWAKDTALAVVEREKPKIQAALTSMKEAAIKEAKILVAEKTSEVKELLLEKAENTAQRIEASVQEKRDSLPDDAPVKDKIGTELYAIGGLGLAQLLRMWQASQHEGRKAERDKFAELEKKIKNGGVA